MVRANGIQSPLIAELAVNNVEFVREITSAKCVCQEKIAAKPSILQKKLKSIMIQRNPY